MNSNERNDLEQRFIPTFGAHIIVAGEIAIMLDLFRDEFLGLSKVARHMWVQLAAGKTPLEVAQTLGGRYEVAPATLLTDLLQFIHTMEARGLLERGDEGSSLHYQSTTAITLEGWEPDHVATLPFPVTSSRQWQNPAWQESFATLEKVDELLKQVGLNTFARALIRLPAHRTITTGDAETQRLADALTEAADWLPFKAACLHQSLALAWMLRRRGMCVDVVIGVYTHPFSAHVWVESDGHIIQWRTGMRYYADFRRIEAMSVIFHTGTLASTKGDPYA